MQTKHYARVMKAEATKLRERILLMTREDKNSPALVEGVTVGGLTREKHLKLIADELDDNADKLFAFVEPPIQNNDS